MDNSSKVVRGGQRVVAGCLALLLLSACSSADSEEPGGENLASPAAPRASAVDVDEGADAAASEPVFSATTFLTNYRAGVARTWAAGVATSEAKELFQDTFVDWESQWELLKKHEREKVRVPHRPELLWTTTVSEEVTLEGEDVVTLKQCLDATNTGITRHGQPITPVPANPTAEFVTLKRSDGTWKITKYEESGEQC